MLDRLRPDVLDVSSGSVRFCGRVGEVRPSAPLENGEDMLESVQFLTSWHYLPRPVIKGWATHKLFKAMTR